MRPKNRRLTRKSKRHQFQLAIEQLETRRVLTSTLYLDFGAGFFGNPTSITVDGFKNIDGPGVVAGENVFGTGSDLEDIGPTGQLLQANDNLTFEPLSYDFNDDGSFTVADVNELAAAVAEISQEAVAPFDIDVQVVSATNFNDVVTTMGSNDGASGDGFGENDSYVFVTTVTSPRFTADGGSVGDNGGLFGIAAASDLVLQANVAGGFAEGNNRDEAALTFADTVFGSVSASTTAAFNANLAYRLAYTTVHEAAHTLGLLHTIGDGSNTNQILLSRGDQIRFGSDTRDARNIFKNFSLAREEVSGDENNGEYLYNDKIDYAGSPALPVDIGPKDVDRNGIADEYYVTGTGAWDRITISNGGSGIASVLVEAFNDPAMQAGDLIENFSYNVDLATDADGAILIDGSINGDEIIINSDVDADFRIKGHLGGDTVILQGAATNVAYTFDSDDGTDGDDTVVVTNGAIVQNITFDEELENIDDNLTGRDVVTITTSGAQPQQLVVSEAGSGTVRVTSNRVTTIDVVLPSSSPTADQFAINADPTKDNVIFNGPLALPDLSVAANEVRINGGSITTDGDQTYNAPVVTGGDTTIAGANVTFNGTIDEGSIVTSGSVGEVDNTDGGGFRSFSAHLEFTVTQKTTLEEVFVYADAATDVTVDLYDATGETLLQTKNFAVDSPNTKTAIPVNFVLEPGNYILHSDSQNDGLEIFRNNSGVTFPYTNGPISITRSSAGTGFYYWFYDWQFSFEDTGVVDTDLVIDTSAGGTTTFNGVVGGTSPLNSISTNADGNTVINAAINANGGTMTFMDDVSFVSAQTLTDTGTTGIRFDADVNVAQNIIQAIAPSVRFQADADYQVAVESTTAGPNGHGQLQVTGNVEIETTGNGVDLVIDSDGYQAKIGDQITILTNDGADAISGTFHNLAEGSSVQLGGGSGQISYVGGDGNDVVITIVAEPPKFQSIDVNPGTANANRSGVGEIIFSYDKAVTVDAASDLRIFNHSTGSEVSSATASLVNNGTAAVTFDLSTLTFADGRYSAELPRTEVTDADGLSPEATLAVEFTIRRGDVDGDTAVDTADFFVVSSNFDPIAGDAWRPGDADGDGAVDTVDFFVISQQFDPIGLAALEYDYGDLTNTATSYGTLLAESGPRHIITGSGLQLGAARDGETDGQPSIAADGDTNDDGISLSAPLTQGATLNVNVAHLDPDSTGGFVNGWMDFNQDGDFDDAGEQILTDGVVSGDATTAFAIDVPADAATGAVNARFRLTQQQGYSYQGLAPNGEVEDYQFAIVAGGDSFASGGSGGGGSSDSGTSDSDSSDSDSGDSDSAFSFGQFDDFSSDSADVASWGNGQDDDTSDETDASGGMAFVPEFSFTPTNETSLAPDSAAMEYDYGPMLLRFSRMFGGFFGDTDISDTEESDDQDFDDATSSFFSGDDGGSGSQGGDASGGDDSGGASGPSIDGNGGSETDGTDVAMGGVDDWLDMSLGQWP